MKRRSFFGFLLAPAVLLLLKVVEWVKLKYDIGVDKAVGPDFNGLSSAWTDKRDVWNENERWGWKRENGEWTHSVQIMGVDSVDTWTTT